MSHRSLHRRDIDGLRAVALLPVILFHLGFRYAPGGFLGVDVFFVISGYLITSHIMTELDGGRFSLTTFYERRIRRIVPALVFMLGCASVAAYLLLLPAEMISFEKSLLATVFSVSNFYFLATTSYFSPGDKPLLHTWSLAVEEQFYMLMPLCLALISRYGPQVAFAGTCFDGAGLVPAERLDAPSLPGCDVLPPAAARVGAAAGRALRARDHTLPGRPHGP